MKAQAISALALIALTLPVAAHPQRQTKKQIVVAKSPAKVEPPICMKMMADYEDASKKLALSQAEGALDDSAPRATMRESQNANVINQARMTMDLMKSNGCTMPTFIPSASRYGLASLSCTSAMQSIRTKRALDRLNDRFVNYPNPIECDTSTWKPNN